MSDALFDARRSRPKPASRSAKYRSSNVEEDVAFLSAHIPPGARVLDFGGGDGHLASVLAKRGFRVIAMNLVSGSPDMDLALAGEIDVAVCTPPLRLLRDAEILTVLRAVRTKLPERGILILAQENGSVLECETLVRASGFEVGYPSSPDWVFATAIPVAPAGLSLRVYRNQTRAALDLRWSPDEADFIIPTLAEIWAPLLTREIVEIARDYALTDPWGSERAAPFISSYFGAPIAPGSIVFAAGATALLRQLAPIVRGGTLLTTPFIHRDYPIWAAAEGAPIDCLADERHTETLCSRIASVAPQVLYLDRPSASGFILTLDALTRICEQARRERGLVLVDEAYLSYLAGTSSAVSLTPSLDNLVVIRSFSKAYCAGGLRVGFAVAGLVAAAALRRLVAPLQVSELAFRMGLALLAAGDVFVHLRERIAHVKRGTIEVLRAAGFMVEVGHPELPWVLIDDPSGDAQHRLESRAVVGKRLIPFKAATGCGFLRLAVPLSNDRIAQFQRALRSPL